MSHLECAYIATATHLNRGVGDLMRYAALVSSAEATEFGRYHLLPADAGRVQARLPDEGLFAMALYIYSLQPPPNPNRRDEKAQEGALIFRGGLAHVPHATALYERQAYARSGLFTTPGCSKDAGHPGSLGWY